MKFLENYFFKLSEGLFSFLGGGRGGGCERGGVQNHQKRAGSRLTDIFPKFVLKKKFCNIEILIFQ